MDDDWLQLFIADGPLEEGQPITGFVAYASAEFLVRGPTTLCAVPVAARAGGGWHYADGYACSAGHATPEGGATRCRRRRPADPDVRIG